MTHDGTILATHCHSKRRLNAFRGGQRHACRSAVRERRESDRPSPPESVGFEKLPQRSHKQRLSSVVPVSNPDNALSPSLAYQTRVD